MTHNNLPHQVVLLEGNTTLFVGTPTEAAEEHSVWLDELAVLGTSCNMPV